MNLLKSFIRKTNLYKPLRGIYRKLNNIPTHPLLNSKTKKGMNLTYLGTEYGGWFFVDSQDLHGCTIISAGLGEDASFDVEFAQKYNAKIVIIDPTPRALNHFNEIIRNLGSPSSRAYSDGGKQPIEAYDLYGLSVENFSIIDKALWNEKTTLKFFKPNNPQSVSHSIVNFQNNYRTDTPYIEVETTTVPALINELGINNQDIPLFKLDIEGAAIEVISDCLENGFFPKQILVEFDELHKPSEKAFKRVDEIHSKLLSSGYELVKTDGLESFIYYLS
jgi:FkbM family methyltransferase